MEARINYHIRGLFMLREETIPPTLSKHLTNKIFNKPNKEAMEQVLYCLLLMNNPKCLTSFPWPITTFKEAAEFRNAATGIINNLDGFVYEKASNVVGKVNSSLLANPGGPVFVFFVYQLCVYVKFCELKKKGIDVLTPPLYVEDEYIDKKISMFCGISKTNFNKANAIISRIDNTLKQISEQALKYKEIIQNSKQGIKDLKSELLNIERCEVTENEVAKLRQKYIDSYNNFENNKLIAMKCARLADIILKTPETLNANNIIRGEISIMSSNDGTVDLIELLTTIKYTLNNYINWCDQLNNEEVMNENIYKSQLTVTDMTEQMQSYEKLMEILINKIDNLKIDNKALESQVFTSRSLEKIDPRLQSVYNKIPSIVLKAELTDKPQIETQEIEKKSRRSVLLHSTSEPYKYQTISIDDIENIHRATLLLQNKNNDVQNEDDENEHSPILHESIQVDNSFLNTENDNSQYKTDIIHEDTPSQIKTVVLNNGLENHTKGCEVKSVSISRKSIENMKQKFLKIKQGQAMSTIPHSPQSPF